MEQPRRIVWVLGAGFSRPLGGPLLGDLFRPEAWDRLSAYYPEKDYPKLYGPECRVAHALFNYGIAFENGKVAMANGLANGFLRGSDGEHIWADAEAFLASLDTAALDPESAAARRMNALIRKVFDEANPITPSPASIAGAAKRLIAAECSAFLIGADLKSEMWLPFVSWVKKLAPAHTIITFNYDRVLEHLRNVRNNLVIVHPDSREPEDSVRVMKLHGSVDWAQRPAGAGIKISVEEDRNFPFFADTAELAMATPGPAKKALNERMFPLWDRAMRALMSADAIVFIGYRFPATDALARDRLLTAIRENDRPYLAVHAVLGPNTQEPDTVRLHQLLKMTLWRRQEWRHPGTDPRNHVQNAFSLEICPCWGEDFMTAFTPEQVTEPWMKV